MHVGGLHTAMRLSRRRVPPITLYMGNVEFMAADLTWAEYVHRVAPGKTQSEIAALAGVDQTVVSRWLSGSNIPRAESIISFARALGRPPLEAMVAGGYITPDEAGMPPDLQISVRELSTEQLLAEIRRRVSDS